MDHDAAGGHPADGATGTGGPERAPGASTTVHRGRGTGTYDEESPMTASDTSASNPLSPGDEVQDPAREQVSDQTRRTEDDDARTASGADREPTEEEERLAEQAGDVDPSVGEHYQEMAERGADVQGEGQITP